MARKDLTSAQIHDRYQKVASARRPGTDAKEENLEWAEDCFVLVHNYKQLGDKTRSARDIWIELELSFLNKYLILNYFFKF